MLRSVSRKNLASASVSLNGHSQSVSRAVEGARGFFQKKGRPRRPVVTEGRYGVGILHDPGYNKGTAFPKRERDRLGIRGLLPPAVFSLKEQMRRSYLAFHRAGGTSQRDREVYGREENKIAKHLFLVNLQDRNETLFYALLSQYIEEMAPIIYTPVVGYACLNHGQLFRRARGMYLSGFEDRGDMMSIVRNWPEKEVDVIVITDGSRILGLGDLGAHGMPIPIGKLSLYVAAAGIDPAKCLPVLIDVGTNNEEMLKDPLYLGHKSRRIEGQEFAEIMDEVMDALITRFPKALIQFEDFKSPYAELFLQRYRKKARVFNDDIQGTGTMVLAGILSAMRANGLAPHDLVRQRVLCVGAGTAGIGVCSSLVKGMTEEGLSEDEARRNFWLVDNKGLLTSARGDDLQSSQIPFARMQQDGLNEGASLVDVIRHVKPTILLGVSGVGGTFTQEVVQAMAAGLPAQTRPIIFPMSNPTDRSECTAEQAYDWSEGRVIFASGSPFPPVERNGEIVLQPSQANNMFIFPGVGLAAVATRSKRISDKMFYCAAQTLAQNVPQEMIAQYRVFPLIRDIREVSKKIAIAVAEVAEKEGLVTEPLDEGETWEERITELMWSPDYKPTVMH